MLRIDVERFFTKYNPDPSDPSKVIGVDYVTYGPAGGLDRTKNTEKVSRLSSVQAGGDSDNLSVLMAKARWEAIRPQYEAWKEGKEIPLDGVPLSAWNLLSPEDAEILKMSRIRTVEDIAALNETQMQRISLPNMRSMVEQAKMFLKAKDTHKAAADMAAMKSELDALRAEMAEMRKPRVVAGEGEVKRRGRKPRQLVEPETEDEIPETEDEAA